MFQPLAVQGGALNKGPIIAAVGVLFGVYVAAAPYITVHQIQAAAENRDGEALSEHIDFPSVRQSLKDQVNAAFMTEMTTHNSMNGSAPAAMGAILAGVVVDRLAEQFIEAYITPAGITRLMAGKQSDTDGQDSDENPVCRPLSDGSMSYESLYKFVVRSGGEASGECKLILRRRGIGWKVTEIMIPMEQGEADDSSQPPAKHKSRKSGKSATGRGKGSTRG